MYSFRRIIAACLLGTGLAPAHAAMFCVSTGDQLASALDSATDNGQPDVIRVRSGVLSRDSADSYDYYYSSIEGLDISGGWGGMPGTCTTQNLQSGATLIDGELESGILHLRVPSGTGGTFSIRNLAFYRGAVSATGYAAVNIEVDPSTTAQVEFSRNSIMSSTSTNGGTAGLLVVASSGETRVIGNLIVNNASLSNTGTGGALIQASAVLYFNNNTVSGNSRNSAQIGSSGVYFKAMAPMWIGNNVISGNTSVPDIAYQLTLDTNSTGQQFHLVNNHFGVTQQGPYSSQHVVSEIGTLYGDPGFLAFNDRRPRADSILVDSGANDVSGGIGSLDFSGNSRAQGAAVERGAYELQSPVLFAHGFE